MPRSSSTTICTGSATPTRRSSSTAITIGPPSRIGCSKASISRSSSEACGPSPGSAKRQTQHAGFCPQESASAASSAPHSWSSAHAQCGRAISRSSRPTMSCTWRSAGRGERTMSDRWLADEIYDAEVNPRGIDLNIRAGPQLREYIAIADRIAADRPGRVLDWGCGWGQMTDLLARRGIDVEAFDVNPAVSEPTRRALENFPPHTALISGDERTLPYPDGGFDAVLSCG